MTTSTMEKIKVMLAFDEGKEIQWVIQGNTNWQENSRTITMYNPDGTINADSLFSYAAQCVRRYGQYSAVRYLRLTNPTFIQRVLNEVKK